jgi:hypothetical protein
MARKKPQFCDSQYSHETTATFKVDLLPGGGNYYNDNGTHGAAIHLLPILSYAKTD